MNPHRRHAGHAAPGRPLRGLYLLTPDDDDTARLLERARAVVAHAALLQYRNKGAGDALRREQAMALLPLCDRKRVVSGKRVSVRVELGGRIITKKKRYTKHT